MPNYEIHKKMGFIASFLFGLIFILLFRNNIPITGWKLLWIPLVILFYSNLPDLDHHMGKLRKRVLILIFSCMALSFIVVYFFDILLMLLVLSIMGLLGLFVLKVPHRGPLHTYWFVLIVASPLLKIHWFLFLLGFISASSHIFIDRLFSKTKKKAKKFFGLQGQTYNHYWHIKV